MCEQGLLLGGKARRNPRENLKDRASFSRRSSDTGSSFINSSTKAYLERLYSNAVTLKPTDDDDVTTSSLQELHKLQKQVQKVQPNKIQSISSEFILLFFSIQIITTTILIHQSFDEHQVRITKKKTFFNPFSSLVAQSPTNSLPLHIIREEHQPTSFRSSTSQTKSSSSSSSSEALYDIDDNEDEMDCEGNSPHQTSPPASRQFLRPSYSSFRMPYHHRTVAPYYCTISPILAQRLPISTTNSSYTP